MGLRRNRIPGSLAAARAMVAYNERILATSSSLQRRHRAARMLANLQPEIQRLEAHEARQQGGNHGATSTPE